MPTTNPLPATIQRALRKEFTTFFTRMRAPEKGWPAIPEQAFIDALADSLTEMAKATEHHPSTYLQTLVIELQDRINNSLKG